VSSIFDISSHSQGDGVTVWWLGQSGVLVRGASSTVAIDPYLTRADRLPWAYEAPFPPSALDFVDVLLATHDHLDHLDPDGFPLILEASPRATGIVPAPVLDRARALAGPHAGRVVGARVDEPIAVGNVRVETIPAVHADVAEDGYDFHLTPEGEHPFVGYIVEVDGVRIGHTGDTLVYEGLAERLRDAELDLLIVPINGVGWFREKRGLAGNMNAFDAAELADLAGARLTMPAHWDLFEHNLGDPEHFVRYAARCHPGVRAHVPELCVPFEVAAHGSHLTPS
jgi:L-ascorbate metabolism protein UlaG (beta-lactamase superfamily)